MQSTLRKSADPVAAKGDLLVVCVADPPKPLTGPVAAVDSALGGLVARAVKAREIDGKAGSATLFRAASGLASPRVVVVGVGAAAREDWRSAGRAAARTASEVKARSVAVVPPESASVADIGAFVEGFGVGAYRFDRFKTGDDAPARPGRLAVHSPIARSADLRRADRVAEAVNGARDLSNTPANHLTPTILAERAKELADGIPGLTCTVLGRARLEKLGAGALLAVAQGSDEPPRMIVLRYRPPGVSPQRRGAGSGREGGDVRHRRHLDQALGRDGGDEARHGRRRGGARGDGAGGGARAAGRDPDRDPGHGEHAERTSRSSRET